MMQTGFLTLLLLATVLTVALVAWRASMNNETW